MAAKFFALLTNLGAAKLANAAALGTKLEITQMAVGDGAGLLPTPDPAQTALKGEVRRAAINLLTVDPLNASQVIAEQVIPENEGGWWIREIGLYDKDGVLIAIANCPETYKPLLQEGSGRTQTIRVVLIVSSVDTVTLKIDPSVVLATRKYTDDKAIEVKAYADDVITRHLAAGDPHPQYAPKASPTFTGVPIVPTPAKGNNSNQAINATFLVAALADYALKVSPTFTGAPKAPTATKGDNTTQIATTEFVQTALTALLDGAPGTLDTLNELAAALGDDPNFSATVLAAIAGKLAKDQNGADILDKALFMENLGLGDAAKRSVGTGTNQIPDMNGFASGDGWMKLPSGKIIQSGYSNAEIGTAGFKLNFLFPFPNECSGLVITGWNVPVGHSGRNANGAMIRIITSITGTGFDWIAFGY